MTKDLNHAVEWYLLCYTPNQVMLIKAVVREARQPLEGIVTL